MYLIHVCPRIPCSDHFSSDDLFTDFLAVSSIEPAGCLTLVVNNGPLFASNLISELSVWVGAILKAFSMAIDHHKYPD